MKAQIPIYIIDDPDWSENDDSENEWSYLRFFIPTSFSSYDISKYYVFTVDDGTFELEDSENVSFSTPSLYRKNLPVEFWREFLKNILTNTDITRRAI